MVHNFSQIHLKSQNSKKTDIFSSAFMSLKCVFSSP